MKHLYSLILAASLAIVVSPVQAATCSGGANCRACKNCRYCKKCAKEGGKCSVCDDSTSVKISAAKTVRKSGAQSSRASKARAKRAQRRI